MDKQNYKLSDYGSSDYGSGTSLYKKIDKTDKGFSFRKKNYNNSKSKGGTDNEYKKFKTNRNNNYFPRKSSNFNNAKNNKPKIQNRIDLNIDKTLLLLSDTNIDWISINETINKNR
jgi:hypothetical protein